MVGCGETPPAPAPGSRKLLVLATVYPLADVAKEVGGDQVETSWLIESGQSIDGVQATGELRNRLQAADLVFMGGATEQWASEGFGQSYQHGRIVRLDVLPGAQENTEGGLIWLDPEAVKAGCKELTTRLQMLRAKNAEDFRLQGEQYVSKIDALEKDYRSRLSQAQTRKILGLNSDFSPLLRRFGLQCVVAMDVAPSRLTDANIQFLKQLADENGTRLLIIPADIPALLAKDLEARTGLQLVRLDSLGSSAAGGRNSYLDLMRWNLDQLLRATTIQ